MEALEGAEDEKSLDALEGAEVSVPVSGGRVSNTWESALKWGITDRKVG
jgi:hypothetical protein